MGLKKILISASIGLILSTHCFADPKPDRCPSIDVIKYRGLLLAAKNSCTKTYVAAQYDRYGTSAPWIFLIEDLSAKDATVALNQASKLLTTLTGNPEPKLEELGWVCEYQIEKNQTVYAYSPNSDESLVLIPKIKK